MTDQLNDTPPDSGGGLTFDAAQTASLRETWIAAGHDPAVFDAAASGAADDAPGDPAADANAPDVLPPSKLPTLTQAQAQDLAASLIAAGRDPAEVAAALAADGYEAPAPDTRTEGQIDHDDVWGGAAPSDYHLNFRGRANGADIEGIAATNTATTHWLAAIGFPPSIGVAVAERAIDVGQVVGTMTEPQRALWAREQANEFARLAGGPEQAEERLKLASKALARGGEAFAALLRETGALDDAFVLTNLALQGERLAVRETV
jgi:hypothetical protein